MSWDGEIIKTGIFKEPVNNLLEVKGVNIAGDDQADRKIHGGINKSIFAYPVEHNENWRNEYPAKEMPFGMFGENLTTEGIFEDKVNVGDTFKVGTTELIAVQPRMPCYKLGIRFNDQEIQKKFLQTSFSGIYFKIAIEGSIKSGDSISLLEKDPNNITILDIYSILRKMVGKSAIINALKLKHLPEELKIEMGEVLKTM